MSKSNDYVTGKGLDYSYHQNYSKFIGIDLQKQAKASIPQKINILGKIEGDDGTKNIFIAEKQHKNYSKLYFGLIKYNRIM